MSAPTTIVDTSSWIDHLHGHVGRVRELLRLRRVLMHPMIVGEIALGSIRNRERVLSELRALPSVPIVCHSEVMEMIDLHNSGIGFVDAHLLAAVRRVPDGTILTRDKKLRVVAMRLSIAVDPA